MKKNKSLGFTLLELVITLAIISILAVSGVGFYRNFSRNLGVSETNRGITSELKTARAKSMNGEDDMKWGVHFVNGTSDYYELFSTPTNYADGSRVTKETVYLSGGVAFSYPTEGNTTDIIFDKIYGSTTPATYVTVTAENNYATTTISSNGQIY